MLARVGWSIQNELVGSKRTPWTSVKTGRTSRRGRESVSVGGDVWEKTKPRKCWMRKAEEKPSRGWARGSIVYPTGDVWGIEMLVPDWGVSCIGSSASNRLEARRVQTVEERIRALKDALECAVPSNHNVFACLVEFTWTTMNRSEVGEEGGRDGKTPYMRLSEKEFRLVVLELGYRLNFWWTSLGVRPCSTASGVTECFLDTDQSVENSWWEPLMAFSRRSRCSGNAYEHRWDRVILDMVASVSRSTSPSAEHQSQWHRVWCSQL